MIVGLPLVSGPRTSYLDGMDAVRSLQKEEFSGHQDCEPLLIFHANCVRPAQSDILQQKWDPEVVPEDTLGSILIRNERRQVRGMFRLSDRPHVFLSQKSK